MQVCKIHKYTCARLVNLPIDILAQVCYNIDTVRERLLCGGNTKGSEDMKPMTNDQARRFEELIKENIKLKAKIKKLKKKLKKKK